MTNPTGSILLRRGPTSDRTAFTPLEGEIIYDTLLKKIFIGDGLTPGGRTVTSDIVIGGSGEILNIPNTSLENSTISGVELGQNLRTLTFGTGLTGTSYNGSTAVTVAIDATSNNTLNSIVARDTNGDFSARRITATLIGNADTVTNGVYSSGSYSDPSWITSLGESKVLPAQGPHAGKVLTTNGSITSWTNLIPVSPAANQMAAYGKWLNTNGTTLQWTDPFPTQSGNSGKFLSTNGSTVGWASASAVGFPSIVGNDGKFLTVSGTDVVWGDVQGGDSANTPNKMVLRDSSGNFAAGTITANLTGNVTGSLTGNASTVTNGVYTSNSYFEPSWITGLSIAQGGTGANNKSDALTNLLPTGESVGYVLTTTGRGTYFWAAGGGGGGGGTVGNTLSSSRITFTATEGQTLFSGVGTYVPGAGQLRIFIDGVRQFPSEYSETSSTSFTLNDAVPAGVKVFAEVDAYTGTEIPASTITFSPINSIESTNVQLAITELEVEKAPLASPTFTGTVSGVTKAMVGLGNVDNESKATMFSSPTFTGTVSGVTAAHVGLDNVTNESKATMFSSPTFTGTVSGVTSTHVGLGNVTNESKATMFSSPTFTGTVSGVTKTHVGLGNVDNTTDAGKPVSTATQTALDLKAPLASPTFSGSMAFATSSTVNFTNATVSGLSVSAFPSGTRLVFAQTTAPTGWTKVTTNDDAALRVVSGTAGSGGTVNFSSAFTTQGVSGTVGSTTASGTVGSTTAAGTVSLTGTVGSTTLTSSQMPSHTHTPSQTTHQFVTNDFPTGASGWTFGPVSGTGNMNANGANQTASAGSSSSHNHTFSSSVSFNGTSHNHSFSGTSHNHSFSGTSIDLSVKYVDTIIATKD